MGFRDADQAPAESGDVIEPRHVAGELSVIEPVLLAVVLEDRPILAVHEVTASDDASTLIDDRTVDLGLGEPRSRSIQPQFGLGERVGARTHEIERFAQPLHSPATAPAMNCPAKVAERRDRPSAPSERVADEHELPH